MKNRLAQWKKYIKEHPCLLQFFCCLTLVYAVGASALLRSNYSYRDDLRRAAWGTKGWENYGRHLSNFLSTFLHADSFLTDISPLSQFIAILLTAFAGTILWRCLAKKESFTIWDLAALVPFGLSPYYLGCISYKYDCPYMALSVYASVLPVLFFKYGYAIYIAAAAAGSLIMCTTYQASSGIFPMLVLLLCFSRWNQKENFVGILKFAASSAAGYFAGLMLFRSFLMPSPQTNYVSSNLPPFKNLLPETLHHLKKYFVLVKDDFKREWILLIAVMMLAFLFAVVRNSKRNKFAAVLVSLLVLCALLCMSFGMYPVLSKPLFKPRAMYGIGVFIAMAGIVLSACPKIYAGKLACLALSWCFFVFSFTYGNALAVQEDYSDFRIEVLLNDLNSLDIMTANHGEKNMKIQFSNSIEYASAIGHMPKDYEMLNHLMPETSTFTNGIYKFFNYYGLKYSCWNKPKESGLDLASLDLPLLKDTMYHAIRGRDDCILIEFK